MKLSPTVLFTLMELFSLSTITAQHFRIDYTPVGHVRTDAILSQDCLSDHVHSFYGPALLYPAVTETQLVNSDPTKSSGNVLDNLSLYWHPAIYRINSDGTRTLVESDWTTVYYGFEPGYTKAFPSGFRMIGDLRNNFGCVDDSPCERDNCEEATNSFFPTTRCREAEVSMRFPSCWDNKTVDDPDQNHVVPALGDGEAWDRCPDTHPVPLPVLELFFRIFNYEGGPHEFADGTGRFHADYVNGWQDLTFLQNVIDNCPESDDVTECSAFPFQRHGPRYDGNDENFRLELAASRVPLADTSCITDEQISGVTQLPRITCTGNLISANGICEGGGGGGSTPRPTARPTSHPTPQPAGDCSAEGVACDESSPSNNCCTGICWNDVCDCVDLCEDGCLDDANCCADFVCVSGACHEPSSSGGGCGNNDVDEFQIEKKGKLRTKTCEWLTERTNRPSKWCDEEDHLTGGQVWETCPEQCAD